MWTVITRPPGPALQRCALTYMQRRTIDVHRALAQHQAYQQALSQLGARVITLPPADDLADACFVEDTAIVFDEIAVMARPALQQRRAELNGIAAALAAHRNLRTIEAPATVEGGDVLTIDRTVLVGLSPRTNRAGVEALTAIVQPYGYRVRALAVRGCLHLKTAITSIGRRTLLVNPDWIALAELRAVLPHFDDFDIVAVDPSEPFAANALCTEPAILYPEAFPHTCARIAARGVQVHIVDISELQKAEAGLTCLSLRIATRTPAQG